MRILILCILLFGFTIPGYSQPIENQYQSGDIAHYLCDKGIIQIGTGSGTGCWGYRSPDGTEYAVYGVYSGLAIVHTPTMTVVDIVQGPENACGSATGGPRWREMRTYGQFVYATSECTGTNAGLLVIDMSYLPDSAHIAGVYPVNGAIQVTSHSLSIDTTNGYAYLEGITTVGQSIYIHDLSNPAVPVYINKFGIAGGIHDMTAIDDTLYVAEGWNSSFAIYDMVNKMAPILITRVTIPSAGYVHNLWPSDDRKYLATTEETANKTLKIWDMQDVQAITLIGEVLGPSRITHNAYWKGDRIFAPHYEAGFVIFDVSDPTTPTLELQYDTWPTENPNFRGAWGGYPYTNNGLMYASNTDGKLFVLEEIMDTVFDSLWIDTIESSAGKQIEVVINASNSHPVQTFQLPISWLGSYNLSFAGTSRTGTRTEYFQSETISVFDSANERMVITLTSSDNDTVPDLPAGHGPILKLLFDVPANATGEANPVAISPFVDTSAYNPSFASPCLSVLPNTIAGAVQVVGCCIGSRGDVNGNGTINIQDLNYLVAHFFAGGPPPGCAEETDVNADSDISVLDLIYLVSYFFSGGSAPAVCP